MTVSVFPGEGLFAKTALVAVLALELAVRVQAWRGGICSEKHDCRPSRKGPSAGIILLAVLYVASRGTLVFLILAPPEMRWLSLPAPLLLRMSGLVPLTLALWLLTCAHDALGSAFALGPDPSEDTPQRLVVAGPYARMRHPLYTAEMMLLVGYVLLAGNMILAILGVALSAVLVRRARREERHLLAHFGDAYLAYKARTGSFLPRITSPHPGRDFS